MTVRDDYGLPPVDEIEYRKLAGTITDWEREFREADTDDWIAPEQWWMQRVSRLRLLLELQADFGGESRDANTGRQSQGL